MIVNWCVWISVIFAKKCCWHDEKSTVNLFWELQTLVSSQKVYRFVWLNCSNWIQWMRFKHCVHSFAKSKHSGKSDKCPDNGFNEYAYAEQNNNEQKKRAATERQRKLAYIHKIQKSREREWDRGWLDNNEWNSNCSISCWILARLKSRRYQYYIKSVKQVTRCVCVSFIHPVRGT